MTLPHERVNAVNQTRRFLYDLLDPKVTPRIPRNLRLRALSLLRHYPTEYHMDRVCNPKDGIEEPVFGKDIWENSK